MILKIIKIHVRIVVELVRRCRMKQQLEKILRLLNFRTFLILVLCITAIFQFFIMVGSIKQDTYNIELTQISQETIRAVKTVEDTEKTELMRDEAEQAVEPVYTYKQDVADQRISIVKTIFETIVDTKTKFTLAEGTTPSEEKLTQLKAELEEVFTSQPSFKLTDSQLEVFINASDQDLKTLKAKVLEVVEKNLVQPIRSDAVYDVRDNVAKEIDNSLTLGAGLVNAGVTVAKSAVIENEVFDEEKTLERIEQARNSIDPVKILQGQIIIREGEAVDRETIRQLALLGMQDDNSSIKPILGLIIFILLQMLFMYILFDRSGNPLVTKRKHLLVTVIVYLISIIIMLLLNLVTDNFDVMISFLFPTAMATMLVKMLANDKAASVVTVLTAASAGVIFQQSYASVLQMDIALYILFGGFGALYFMRNMEKRTHLLHSVAIVTVINLLFVAFYLLMAQASLSFREILFYIGAAVISGLLSGALTMGLMPFFESAFGILSTMKLIELSNPNHPLFKKILTETPGTYHHSVMVANLAEASCEAIGADGLLARVASYYHDVGKTRRPLMFIENQISGVNPHDSMSPEKSAEIITAHTIEGAELLKKHKMPKEIIDIALQHHGTSALKYFLFKAKEQGKDLNEVVFRYVGPKPQTKEAAVISVADSVEAAVRSMKEPNPEKIHQCIHAIIQDRLQDDQFDECDISIKELKIIEEVLGETLNGIFHSRIEYPK